jgi:hypothetical protein
MQRARSVCRLAAASSSSMVCLRIDFAVLESEVIPAEPSQ